MFYPYPSDQRAKPSADIGTVKIGEMNYTTQYSRDEVEMTRNPAYGPIATTSVKNVEVQYEEVSPPTGGWAN